MPFWRLCANPKRRRASEKRSHPLTRICIRTPTAFVLPPALALFVGFSPTADQCTSRPVFYWYSGPMRSRHPCGSDHHGTAPGPEFTNGRLPTAHRRTGLCRHAAGGSNPGGMRGASVATKHARGLAVRGGGISPRWHHGFSTASGSGCGSAKEGELSSRPARTGA